MYKKVQPNTTKYSEFMHYCKNLCTARSVLWEFMLPPVNAKPNISLAKEEDK